MNKFNSIKIVVCFGLATMLAGAGSADESNVLSADEAFQKGNSFATSGDFDSAIRWYGEAIRLNPRFAEAYYWRGRAFADKRMFEKAIAEYSEAIRLNPQVANAYYHFSAHFVSIFREFLFRVKSPILHCNWVSSGIEFAGRIGSVFRLN